MDNETKTTSTVNLVGLGVRHYDECGEITREVRELKEISRKLDRIIDLLESRNG